MKKLLKVKSWTVVRLINTIMAFENKIIKSIFGVLNISD